MKYPILVSQQQDVEKTILNLEITAQTIYFDGHFDNTPVLAGVVQVDWAIHFASEIFKLEKQSFKKIDQMKFTQVILPNMKVSLSLMLTGSVLTFKYFNQSTIYSSGKLRMDKK